MERRAQREREKVSTAGFFFFFFFLASLSLFLSSFACLERGGGWPLVEILVTDGVFVVVVVVVVVFSSSRPLRKLPVLPGLR